MYKKILSREIRVSAKDWRTNRHHRACERTQQRSAWWSRDGWPSTHRASKGGPGERLVAAARDSPSLQDLCVQASSANLTLMNASMFVEARRSLAPFLHLSFLFAFLTFGLVPFTFYLCFPVICSFWEQRKLHPLPQLTESVGNWWRWY